MADQTEAFRKLGEEILDLAVEKHFLTEGMFHPETGDPIPENHYEQNFVVGSENWESIKDALGPDLPDLFASFGLPDPDKFEPIKDELEQAFNLTEGEEVSWLHSETLMLDGWTGFALDKFRLNYLSDWYDKVQAHRELTKSLVTVIYGSQELYYEAHETVLSVGDGAKSALEEIDNGWSWGGKSTFDVVMSILGMATATAALLTGGVTLIGTAGLVIQGLNSVVSTASSAISSTTPIEVINETRTKLGQVSEYLAENERVIAKEVLDVNIVELAKEVRQVLPPEPDLANIKPGESWEDFRWRSGG